MTNLVAGVRVRNSERIFTLTPNIVKSGLMLELTSITARIKDCQGRIESLRRYL